MYRFEHDRPPELLLAYKWWTELGDDNQVAAQMTETSASARNAGRLYKLIDWISLIRISSWKLNASHQ